MTTLSELQEAVFYALCEWRFYRAHGTEEQCAVWAREAAQACAELLEYLQTRTPALEAGLLAQIASTPPALRLSF